MHPELVSLGITTLGVLCLAIDVSLTGLLRSVVEEVRKVDDERTDDDGQAAEVGACIRAHDPSFDGEGHHDEAIHGEANDQPDACHDEKEEQRVANVWIEEAEFFGHHDGWEASWQRIREQEEQKEAGVSACKEQEVDGGAFVVADVLPEDSCPDHHTDDIAEQSQNADRDANRHSKQPM